MKKNYMSIPAVGFKLPKITQLARHEATFERYQDRKLWYSIQWSTAPDIWPEHLDPEAWDVVETRVFEFSVPVDDAAATGQFTGTMKAITLMRWINQHIAWCSGSGRGES